MSVRAMLALAVSDLKRQLRQRETVFWLLIMPLPFMLFFGVALRESPPQPAPVTLVAPQPDAAADQLAAALIDADFAVTVRPDAADLGKDALAVELPPAAAGLLASGGTGTVVVQSPAGSVRGRRLEVEVQKWLWGQRAHLLVERLQAGEGSEAAVAAPLTVDASDWGVARPVPTGFKQSIPGNLVMFTLMAVLVTGAVRLLDDRQAGRLHRILVLPVAPATVVAAQLLSLLVAGLVEVGYLLLVSVLVFRLDLHGHGAAAFGVLVLLVLAMAGVGVLYGALLRNHAQGVAAGLFTTLGLAALGGCWWPLEVVPRSMQHLAMLLPTGQAMHALVRLLVWGDHPGKLVGAAVYLAVFAAVTATAAAWALRRRLAE